MTSLLVTSRLSARSLLVSRLQLRRAQRSQLHERIGQLKEQITGLERIREATAREMFQSEVGSLEELREKRLVNLARYNALRRNQAQTRGLLGRTIADMARARGKISETELEIATLNVNAQSEILEEREKVEGELSQLTEKLRAARDRFSPLDTRASDDGVIHELAAHTVGGVIQAGAVVAQIVPVNSRLVVDAMVQTIDRDQIHDGMPARVRFTAFNQRETPALSGASRASPPTSPAASVTCRPTRRCASTLAPANSVDLAASRSNPECRPKSSCAASRAPSSPI
jgi:HlyD family secretion protein